MISCNASHICDRLPLLIVNDSNIVAILILTSEETNEKWQHLVQPTGLEGIVSRDTPVGFLYTPIVDDLQTTLIRWEQQGTTF